MSPRVTAIVAVAVLSLGVLTAVLREPPPDLIRLSAVRGAMTAAWVTGWSDDQSVIRVPGRCDVTADCLLWVDGAVNGDGGPALVDNSAFQDAPVVQFVAEGDNGIAGIVSSGLDTIDGVSFMDPIGVAIIGRTITINWSAPTTSGTVQATLLACTATDTCFVVGDDVTTPVTVSREDIASAVSTGTSVERVMVRVDADNDWWWSAPAAGQLDEPVTGSN